MAVITEGIKVSDKAGLNFGNYMIKHKLKVDGYEYLGDEYKVRTHDIVTRLEKNEKLLYESVPGSAVENFVVDEKKAEFSVEGHDSTQITLELEPETEYKIQIDGADTGKMKSNLSGKVIFSAELSGTAQSVVVEKI